MAYTYWVSFRIAEDATYNQRYKSLMDAFEKIRIGSYTDTTSFYLLQSEFTIDEVLMHLTYGLDAKKDLVLIATLNGRQFSYFGLAADVNILSNFLPLSS